MDSDIILSEEDYKKLYGKYAILTSPNKNKKDSDGFIFKNCNIAVNGDCFNNDNESGFHVIENYDGGGFFIVMKNAAVITMDRFEEMQNFESSGAFKLMKFAIKFEETLKKVEKFFRIVK